MKAQRARPEFGKPRSYLGIGEARVDLFIELDDDLSGCALGCADAKKRACFIPRQKFAQTRDLWSASERVAVVTASTRSLPALMCSIDAGRLSNAACTCPPSKSMSIGAEPRYGT